MSDFVMNLAVVLLTPWVGFCSKSVLRYCWSSLNCTAQPTFVLGFTQFANFPGKCEYFIPFREVCVWFFLWCFFFVVVP